VWCGVVWCNILTYNFYYFEVCTVRFASVGFVAFRSEYCESQSFRPKRDDAPGCARGLVRVVIGVM